MVVEKLGGGQNHRPDDGPRYRRGLRGREETKEEAPARLFVRQFEKPQLVGVPLLLLRAPRLP